MYVCHREIKPESAPKMSMTPRLANNEGKCLDAILQVLEKEQQAVRCELIQPEKTHDPFPVELVCKVGESSYAFEHTRLETFSEQIGDGVNFANVTDRLVMDLEGQLPGKGLYQLIIPPYATRGIKKHQISGVGSQLAVWIKRAACELEQQGDMGSVSDIPSGVPFSVTLKWQPYHLSSQCTTRLSVCRSINDADLSQKRIDQMNKVVDNKYKKLRGWVDRGAIDVLILENWDNALSHFELDKEAFRIATQSRDYVPSNVYHIETSVSQLWVVRAIRHNGTNVQNSDYLELINPIDLTDPRAEV